MLELIYYTLEQWLEQEFICGQTTFTAEPEVMVQESSAAFGTEWMLCSAEEKLLPSLTAEKGIPLLGFNSEKQLYQG